MCSSPFLPLTTAILFRPYIIVSCNGNNNSHSNNPLGHSTSPCSNNSCWQQWGYVCSRHNQDHMANVRCNHKRQRQQIQQWLGLAGTARNVAGAVRGTPDMEYICILATASSHGHCTYSVYNIFLIESRSSATKAELRRLPPPFGFLL
jgi:hypothetical protein